MAEDQKPMPGYVRSEVQHVQAMWQFELWSEQPKIAIVTIETQDGPVQVGLNRQDASRLIDLLRSFLADRPEDQLPS
jgi:hypothetical protein